MSRRPPSPLQRTLGVRLRDSPRFILVLRLLAELDLSVPLPEGAVLRRREVVGRA